MRNFTCPWCGFCGSSTDSRFIATSASLIGDPVLGSDQQLRFMPTRFDAGGCPVDPDGGRSPQPACPACRRAWPECLWSSAATGLVRLTGDDAASTRTKLIAHARQRLSTLEIILSQVAAAQPTADLDIAACMLAFPDGSHRTVFLTTTDTPRGPEVVLAGAGTDAPPARPGTTTLQLAASGQPPPPLISITNRVTLARCGTLDSGAIEVEEGPEAMAAALLLATGLREDTAAHA